MATVLFCLKQTQDMSRFLKIITALQIPEYPLRFFKRIQQALYQIDIVVTSLIGKDQNQIGQSLFDLISNPFLL